jgi:hypothetical protein
MSSTIILKASGLQTSPNELSRDDGALIEAKNIIIKRDNIIEQRRGFDLYGSELPISTNRVKQLTTYRTRILRHYSNKLAFDSTGNGSFLDFAGTYMETETGLRMKFIESNGNFYFTTSEGIKKISARTSNDFSTTADYIVDAGAVKAVDLTGNVIYEPNSQSAWFPQDSAVAYRAVWGYKDLNANLVLGTPSQRLVVNNPMIDLLTQDYMRLLSVLDNFVNTPLTTARINDKNYLQTLGVNLSTSASQLQSSMIALASKLDADIFYADQAAAAPLQMNAGAAVIAGTVCTITFASGNPSLYFTPGSKIFLAGFAPATGTLNGGQTVVTANATTLTFNTTATGPVVLSSATIVSNEYRSLTLPSAPSTIATNDELLEQQNFISEVILRLSAEPTTVVSAGDQVAVDTLDVTTTVTTELTITIPEGINSNYFFQVYRSSIAQALGAATFEDLAPSDELQLVYEAYPTADEIEAGSVTFEDITPDAFRGANLYTNAATGEGILQSNDVPPFAKDINRYRNSIFYANTRTRQRMELNLLGVTQMLADYIGPTPPKITISNGDVSTTYEFVIGLEESSTVTTVADVANSLNNKYFLISSLDTDYYVWYNTGAGVDPAISGRTGIQVVIATGATANQVATATFNALVPRIAEWSVSVLANVVTITNTEVGYCTNGSAGNSGFTVSVVTDGKGESVQSEITSINAIAGNLFVGAGASDYFLVSSAFDARSYYVWFQRSASTDPAIAGRVGIQVTLTGAETNAQVAQKIADALAITDDFRTEVVSNVITIETTLYGRATNSTEFVANAGFTMSTTQEGRLEVLLSDLDSPARAVDETARSFVRVINKNPGDIVYAYYLSSVFDVPGKMLLESRTLQLDDTFYILANTTGTGASFNPDIGPELFITSVTTGVAPVITTSTDHGMLTGDQIMISGTDSTPVVNGLWEATVLSPTTFSITGITVTVAGTVGVAIRAVNSVYSENEEKANRVYFSKLSQPEAVPSTNYFDVGAQDKAILRIVPLRDSLFVFKEDGLYRISGESAPFQLELFDNSFILLAPDSADICNNVIFSWTTQGIQSLSESGSNITSRNIDNILLRTQSSNFPGFKTATWGIGYQSDNSYLVFTVVQETDTIAEIGYRYSTLTDSWTTYDMSKIAGVINSADDKLYLAASDVAYIEQERKTFSRLDYTDRELFSVISMNKLIGSSVILPSVVGFDLGDVLVQDQTLTTTQFNILLRKLDLDPGVTDTNYVSTLTLLRGAAPRAQLELLATKLDSDTGVNFSQFSTNITSKSGTIAATTAADQTVITATAHGLKTGRVILIDSSLTTPSINGTWAVTVLDANRFSIPAHVAVISAGGNWQTVNSNFDDIKVCYNFIVTTLNSDTGVAFNNYALINNNTIMEAIVTGINRVTNKLTLNMSLDYLVGDVSIFKAFESRFTYSPITMGDPLMLKHLREATLMFETRTLTGGILSFRTDLLPEFQDVPFNLDGNGIFGHITNFGDNFFGGISNAAPFRTYVPRQCQRCRYMIMRFAHKTAREDYRVNGATLTGEIGQSTRAFR